ncbi:hypothetical protein SASPL_125397 [Salvia splendens]|uniref:Uncharacterized protein n=1 Tax=Salvia splendens TaxID=180675 RepID=A0A8X8ZP53_SALSN|nr:hypothetical protein SASPL_125397 [Salvia splendens]
MKEARNNMEEEWNKSFNYSSNLDFLSKCIAQTQGDLPQRLCTAAELKFYFTNFIARKKSTISFLKPNTNCNSPDFTDSQEMPARTSNCQSCCEGFFCMIRINYCLMGSTSEKRESIVSTLNRLVFCSRILMYFLSCVFVGHCSLLQVDIVQSQLKYTEYKPIWSNVDCEFPSREFMVVLEMIRNSNEVNCRTFLFIFYNCYEQVITIGEKRHARSRETAVRSVKENARAQARWQAAKDAIPIHFHAERGSSSNT